MQTEFNLLKKATSKNIKNLHNTINLQQTYTTFLCSHINSIYTKLAQLDRQIQTHCLYPHSQLDPVQLNAPEYDSDIDGQTDILPDMQTQASLHAENTEEDLHNTINLQQTYTTFLCSHINSIYTKLAQLDRQIQTHCLYPHSQLDPVQLNAPEYDSDIDGQTDILPDMQTQASLHAENTEEDPAPATANSKEYSALPQDSDRLESQSQSVLNHPEHSLHQDTEQSREHTTTTTDPN